MEALSKEAKIAVVRILTDIINADNVRHSMEVEYLNQVVASLDMEDDWQDAVAGMVTLQSLAVIKELPQEQKDYISQLMGNMIVIDKDINYNEVKLYNMVCKSAGITRAFDVNKYVDCTMSGPFVNPEDLMEL